MRSPRAVNPVDAQNVSVVTADKRKEAGLVTDQREGTRRIYRLEEEGLHTVKALLERMWREPADAERPVSNR